MYDINFFMKSYPIRKRLESGEKISQEKVLELFEDFRSKDPVIYNIETTNACNMTVSYTHLTLPTNREV